MCVCAYIYRCTIYICTLCIYVDKDIPVYTPCMYIYIIYIPWTNLTSDSSGQPYHPLHWSWLSEKIIRLCLVSSKLNL
jgi:hypothetical protein